MIPNNQFWFNKSKPSFKPSDISGLILEAYSENSIVSGNNITQITDTSGNNNHLTQATSTSQPQLIANQYNGYPASRNDGIDDYMTFPTITNLRTVFLVIKERPNAGSDFRPILGHNTLYPFHRGTVKNYFDVGVSSANVTNGIIKLDGAVIPVSNPVPTKMSVTSIVTTGNVTVNNFASDRLVADRIWDGDFCALLIYDNPLSNSDVILVENYLKGKYAITPYNVIYDGDSFFATRTVDQIVTGLVSLNKGPSTQNVAVGGSGIGVTTNAGSNYMLNPTRYNVVKNKYLTGGKNIVCTYEGINDLYYNLLDGNSVSTSVNNVYNNFLTYVNGLTALGFKVIINTLTPRNNVGTPANYESARQNASNKLDNTTINGKLRNDFTVSTTSTRIFKSNLPQWNNCILVDVGDDPNFGQIGQETNLIYYDADLVHPTTLMQQQLANNYYVPAIILSE